MKLQPYYLFYLLTLLLIVFGIATKEKTFISPGWHTTIFIGYWFYVMPTASLSIVTAIIYNYFSYTNRPVKTGIIIIHFITVVLGLVFILNLYRTMLVSIPDTTAIAYGKSSLLMTVLAPVFLVTSLVIFITGLVKAHRARTSNRKYNS